MISKLQFVTEILAKIDIHDKGDIKFYCINWFAIFFFILFCIFNIIKESRLVDRIWLCYFNWINYLKLLEHCNKKNDLKTKLFSHLNNDGRSWILTNIYHGIRDREKSIRKSFDTLYSFGSILYSFFEKRCKISILYLRSVLYFLCVYIYMCIRVCVCVCEYVYEYIFHWLSIS